MILAAALSGVLAAGAQTGREWQDPAVNEINRLPMRSSFAAGERLSLDGVWKFHWVRNASERPSGIGAVDYDDAAWGSMPVPGMWELNGYGDPVYVNIGYAWRGNFRNDPPYVPDAENHVGSYRRTFDIPASWGGKDIHLSIGSATSNVYVWVNGRFVGYSEDSKLAAQFDITKFVKPGENLIALQMFRWSDGTYLEDQDFWRFAGIARGVELTARDKAHLEDVRITPVLDSEYKDATLRVEVETTPRVKSVGLTLRDAAGGVVAEHRLQPRRRQGRVCLRGRRPGQMVGRDPEPLYARDRRVGRQGRDRDRDAARGLPFRGDQGRTVARERAARADQGRRPPRDGSRRRLCGKPRTDDRGHPHHERDEYQRRTHEPLSQRPTVGTSCATATASMSWTRPTSSRTAWATTKTRWPRRRLMRRHTWNATGAWCCATRTILRSSSGRWATRAGMGPNFEACYRWIKEYDPSRPVHYERAVYDRDGAFTDIICPMYWGYEQCEKYARNNPSKPLIQCEYAHAMGNSMGA